MKRLTKALLISATMTLSAQAGDIKQCEHYMHFGLAHASRALEALKEDDLKKYRKKINMSWRNYSIAYEYCVGTKYEAELIETATVVDKMRRSR